jgi:hypothetical protein
MRFCSLCWTEHILLGCFVLRNACGRPTSLNNFCSIHLKIGDNFVTDHFSTDRRMGIRLYIVVVVIVVIILSSSSTS